MVRYQWGFGSCLSRDLWDSTGLGSRYRERSLLQKGETLRQNSGTGRDRKSEDRSYRRGVRGACGQDGKDGSGGVV